MSFCGVFAGVAVVGCRDVVHGGVHYAMGPTVPDSFGISGEFFRCGGVWCVHGFCGVCCVVASFGCCQFGVIDCVCQFKLCFEIFVGLFIEGFLIKHVDVDGKASCFADRFQAFHQQGCIRNGIIIGSKLLDLMVVAEEG